MRLRQRHVAVGLATLAAPLGIITAAPAAAECDSSGGVTICAQGAVRASESSSPESTGPYVPYPCEYDWYCDGFDLDVILPPAPGPPDIGLPGTPGNRPGGGGGGGGIGPR